MTKEESLKLGYNATFVLTDLIEVLTVPAPSLKEIDKIRAIQDKVELAKSEYFAKLSELLKERGIEDELKPTDKNYNEILAEITVLFNSGSSLEVKELQQYSREEVASMISGSKEQFSVTNINLIMTVLAKKDD